MLASASPQRSDILRRLGLDFRVAVSGVQELQSGPPEEVALENAYRKAAAVAAAGRHGDAVVIGADTVVAIGPRIYGKPADRDDARATLEALAGREHAVLSAVCVISDGRARTAAARTAVTIAAVCEELMRWYLDSGEWRGRAGAYAIQGRGAALVQRIDGDYTNVVGLPVATLLELAPELIRGAPG